MTKREWKEAKKHLCAHARWRIDTFTEIGGADLEIVDDVVSEAISKCVGLADGTLTMKKLVSALMRAKEEMNG